MENETSAVLIALAFGAMGLIFVFANIAIVGRILRGRRLDFAGKGAPYECGEIVVGDAWVRYNPRFLLLAILFVLFDIEIAFLFPWAVAFKDGGVAAFYDMLFFFGVLAVGFVWFWKLGELKWILPQEQHPEEPVAPPNLS